MERFRLHQLFKRYVDNSITDEERKELMLLIADGDNKAIVMEMIGEMEPDAEQKLEADAGRRILSQILDNELLLSERPVKRRSRLVWAVAAAVAGIVVLSVWHFSSEDAFYKQPVLAEKITPAINKAILTLDDGTQVALGDSVYKPTGLQIKKEQGFMVCTNSSAKNGENKLTTPRGAEYKIKLPDGTKVWLNAASSIKYPAVFAGDKRVVELTGEAFFEVTKQMKPGTKSRLPFIVKIVSAKGENASVDVLGTAFNVNAYEDQDMFKVTLKNGSVNVRKGKFRQKLAPGEQAIVYNDSHFTKLRNIDADDAAAWKDGIFYFENESISSIMNEISRWYDVDVFYTNKNNDKRFDGKISRYADISEVLEILKLGGAKISVLGKTVYVE